MKVFANTDRTNEYKGECHMTYEHKRHIPPHERKTMVHMEFDEKDWMLLEKVFGDADTTAAAVNVIREAPPEIQILAVQLIDIIKEVA